MSAASQGAVDDDLPRGWSQPGHYLVCKHGHMLRRPGRHDCAAAEGEGRCRSKRLLDRIATGVAQEQATWPPSAASLPGHIHMPIGGLDAGRIMMESTVRYSEASVPRVSAETQFAGGVTGLEESLWPFALQQKASAGRAGGSARLSGMRVARKLSSDREVSFV